MRVRVSERESASLEGGIPHSAFLPKISSLLIKGGFSCPCGCLGVITTWLVKAFETEMVIEGFTNKIELNHVSE